MACLYCCVLTNFRLVAFADGFRVGLCLRGGKLPVSTVYLQGSRCSLQVLRPRLNGILRIGLLELCCLGCSTVILSSYQALDAIKSFSCKEHHTLYLPSISAHVGQGTNVAADQAGITKLLFHYYLLLFTYSAYSVTFRPRLQAIETQ